MMALAKEGVISIHVPTKGTTSRLPAHVLYPMYFNPRSHEGNDYRDAIDSPVLSISIHVPTKGTTVKGSRHVKKRSISIHVPTKGTTCSKSNHIQSDDNFNPRSHEGNDSSKMSRRCRNCIFQSTFPRRERRRRSCSCRSIDVISIHVPTKGTTAGGNPARGIVGFQSTFPRRERHNRN